MLRIVRWASAAALVAAVMATAAASPSATGAAASPCAAADALREAGATSTARRAYIALIRRRPALDCAKAGLKRIADDAVAAQRKKTQNARSKLRADALLLCKRGRRLRDAGQDGDALSAYKSALEKAPDLPCVRSGLDRGWLATVGGWLDDIIAALPQVRVIVKCCG